MQNGQQPAVSRRDTLKILFPDSVKVRLPDTFRLTFRDTLRIPVEAPESNSRWWAGVGFALVGLLIQGVVGVLTFLAVRAARQSAQSAEQQVSVMASTERSMREAEELRSALEKGLQRVAERAWLTEVDLWTRQLEAYAEAWRTVPDDAQSLREYSRVLQQLSEEVGLLVRMSPTENDVVLGLRPIQQKVGSLAAFLSMTTMTFVTYNPDRLLPGPLRSSNPTFTDMPNTLMRLSRQASGLRENSVIADIAKP